MRDSLAGIDPSRHLKGTSIFFSAATINNASPIRKAVFWLHLRQEIYNAYLQQRGVITDLSNCKFITDDDSENSDDMWFHQTLYISALVTQWAFGEKTSNARWHELCAMVETWETKRPSSFNQIYFRPRDAQKGRYFPELCYTTDEHVAAAHFFYMAKLLLTTHDPTLPRIGSKMKSAMAAMQRTALSYVRTLIGISICNTWVPARLTAVLAIYICNSLFTNRQEQEALLHFMRETSDYSGWSRQNTQQELVQEWGWTEADISKP